MMRSANNSAGHSMVRLPQGERARLDRIRMVEGWGVGDTIRMLLDLYEVMTPGELQRLKSRRARRIGSGTSLSP